MWVKFISWVSKLPVRVWLWVGAAALAAVAFLSVRHAGKQEGLSEAAHANLKDALNDVKGKQKELKKLEALRIDLASKIVQEAANRTKALEETLTEEEVLRRLREHGLVK